MLQAEARLFVTGQSVVSIFVLRVMHKARPCTYSGLSHEEVHEDR